MKKLLTLFTVFTLAFKLSAQQNNNLVIFSENGERFWVILNGTRQNASAETNVKVTGLIQPDYKVKIIFENKTIPDVNQNVFMSDGGNPANLMEFTYSVSKTKKGYKLKYRSVAPYASVSPTPDQHVVTYTSGQPGDMTMNGNSNGTVNMNTGVNGNGTTTTGTGSGTAGVNMGVNGGGTGFNMNVSVNDGTGQQTVTTYSTTTTTTTTTGTGGGMNMNVSGTGINANSTTDPGNGGHGYDPLPDNTANGNTTVNNNNYTSGSYVCAYPMSQTDFENAKKSVSGQSFADKKLIIAKQVVDNNCLTSEQVKQMTKLLDFEDKRLEFAKYAYHKAYDKGNYYKVNDAFDFPHSVEELDKYIKSHK